MPNTFTIAVTGTGLFLSIVLTAQAESPYERAAFMLSGPDCPSARQSLINALQPHTGILRVDPDVVPDHIVIDYVRSQLSEGRLIILVNEAVGNTARCRAEVMKSCITADNAAHK